jgi:hypothetical protein
MFVQTPKNRRRSAEMEQKEATGRRSPWPYLMGLVLFIVILWYIIRGLGPEERMPMEEDASERTNVPALTGAFAA